MNNKLGQEVAITKIDGVVFVQDGEDEYGERWKVFESFHWNEWKHLATEYGSLEHDHDGLGVLKFVPNILSSDYPLFKEVLQSISTFMSQQEQEAREQTEIGYRKANGLDPETGEPIYPR